MSSVIFCDFDGVIRHWDNSVLYEQEAAFQLPRGTTFKTAFSADLLLPAITGQVKDEVWRGQVTQTLAQNIPYQQASQLVEAWSNSPASIDNHFLKTIRAMMPNHVLALVTNATSRLSQDMATLQIDQPFDYVINSSEIGVAKPAVDFYRQAIQLTGATIDTSLFIDDSLKNVAAAEAFGIKGFHFKNLAELQEELKEWLSTIKK
ncbi:MAG: HAD-IA family hydrolase [Chloroflexota bacterium]